MSDTVNQNQNQKNSSFELLSSEPKKYFFTFGYYSVFPDRYFVIEAASPLLAVLNFKCIFGDSEFNIYDSPDKITLMYNELIVDKNDLHEFSYTLKGVEYKLKSTSQKNAYLVFKLLLNPKTFDKKDDSNVVNFYEIKTL